MKTDMRLGWIPNLPDIRDNDFIFRPKVTIQTIPDSADLFPKTPIPIFDQGNLGSCTANATSRAIAYDLAKQQLPVFTPSRLYLYYWSRSLEHTIKEDAGAMLGDVFKAYNRHGVCDEKDWVYDISKFTKKPDKEDCLDAKTHRPLKYLHLDNRSAYNIEAAIASGYPVVFGFTVYESFYDIGSDYRMPDPKGDVVGGHAVLATGYDKKTGYITIDNSWSDDWGMGGRFYMPIPFVTPAVSLC
jgi:C1A family cysteine protease